MPIQVRPSRPVKQQRLADRPQLILDAAIPIIGQRGYFGFSIKELAQACGLTVPGILHHFGSKEAILFALLRNRELRDFEAVWLDVPVFDAQKLALLSMAEVKRLLHESVVRNSQQPELTRLGSMLRTEALYSQHPAHEFFRKRNARSLETIAHMLAGKVVCPQSAAAQVSALFLGLEILWLDNRENFDLVGEWDRAIGKVLG